MKPFFSYYGSKYRLCQQGFYPAPKSGNIVVEPFAGSATYSVFHKPEQAILIDKYKVITDIWVYLINATPNDIMQLPDVVNDMTELNSLPIGAKNLISFWLHKVAFSPAKSLPSWYLQYRDQATCYVWSKAVKQRIAGQVNQIKGWIIFHGDYNYIDNFTGVTGTTWFIDPPYSGKAGRKYKHSNINYHDLKMWVEHKQAESSQIIACENEDLTYCWADFNQTHEALNMRGKKMELCSIQTSPMNNNVTARIEEKILIPRIVSFSGGRTSGMLLLKLLEKAELKQWRGDCVVFNNTSAEHKATYAFVSRIKKITEEKYNIPFFMLEFQTYEAKTSRGYVRRTTYKMVNDLPYCESDNPNGYKSGGEVFEESISQAGSLPSTYQRSCTINMKILTTNNFLKDWFASKPCIEQLGEFSSASNISDADIVKKHRMYKGELSDEAIIDKKTFVRSCQVFRPRQFFKDYTNADIDYKNSYLQGQITNGCISLFGKNAVKYHNYLGIRFDEKHRAIKIRNRIKDAKLNLGRKNKKGGSIKTQPPFENAKMPFIKAKITKDKVLEFWADPQRSKYDLDLPFDGTLSNCVHCMLKGKSKNQLVAKRSVELENVDVPTPSSLVWWADIERKYSRKVIKSNKNDYTNIGFFGVSKDYVYQTWADELDSGDKETLIKNSEKDSWTMDCNCTD